MCWEKNLPFIHSYFIRVFSQFHDCGNCSNVLRVDASLCWIAKCKCILRDKRCALVWFSLTTSNDALINSCNEVVVFVVEHIFLLSKSRNYEKCPFPVLCTLPFFRRSNNFRWFLITCYEQMVFLRNCLGFLSAEIKQNKKRTSYTCFC